MGDGVGNIKVGDSIVESFTASNTSVYSVPLTRILNFSPVLVFSYSKDRKSGVANNSFSISYKSGGVQYNVLTTVNIALLFMRETYLCGYGLGSSGLKTVNLHVSSQKITAINFESDSEYGLEITTVSLSA